MVLNKPKEIKNNYSKKELKFILLIELLWTISFIVMLFLIIEKSLYASIWVIIFALLFLISNLSIVLIYLSKIKKYSLFLIIMSLIYIFGFISFTSGLGKNMFSSFMAIIFLILTIILVSYGIYIEINYHFLEESKLIGEYLLKLKYRKR